MVLKVFQIIRTVGLVCVFILVSQNGTAAAKKRVYECAANLIDLRCGKICSYRSKIADFNEFYTEQFPKSAKSMLRGTGFIRLNTTTANSSHVIYLESGPDIWRPLYDFPTARHFHFVDHLIGWGRSPHNLISEFIRRINYIGSHVEIVQTGFLDVLKDWEKKRSKERSS